jgi:uncharacterized protein
MSGYELAIGLALLIGISLGALGSGGSIVTMPVLVYVAGMAPGTAVGMSLAVVGGTSLVASYFHFRQGNFHTKAAALFCVSGIVGAYWGSMLTHLVRSSVLMFSFARLMLVVGTLMLTRQSNVQAHGTCVVWRCLLVGTLVGILTGFLGVGGGFLIVPALVFTAGLDAKKAIGSSLAVIAFNSASGLMGQLRFVHIDWRITLSFLIASLAGMGFGVSIVRRVPEQTLRRAFAVALLIIGGVIGYKNALPA